MMKTILRRFAMSYYIASLLAPINYLRRAHGPSSGLKSHNSKIGKAASARSRLRHFVSLAICSKNFLPYL